MVAKPKKTYGFPEKWAYFVCLDCEFAWKIDQKNLLISNFMVVCPNCGADENTMHKGPDGKEINFAGKPLKSLQQSTTHKQIASWKRWYKRTRQALPFKAQPGQGVYIPHVYYRDVWPRLTYLQRSLVELLLAYTDRRTGWSTLSQGTMACYACPAGRKGDLDRKAIRKALRGMVDVEVEITVESEGIKTLPLLQVVETFPHKYKINLPR